MIDDGAVLIWQLYCWDGLARARATRAVETA